MCAWEVGKQGLVIPKIRDNKELASIKGYIEEKEAKLALYEFLRGNVTFASDLLLGVELFPFQHMAIKAIFESDYFLGIWSRGLSKCLEKNSLVFTSKGLKKIIDIEVGDYVQSLNNFNRVTDKTVNPSDTTYKVTTIKGYTSEGLDYHRVLKLNKNLDFEWAFAKDLAVDDVLVMRKNMDFPKKSENIFEGFVWGEKERGRSLSFENVTANDWYYFFGVFIGDGYFSLSNNSLDICSEDDETLNFLERFCGSIGLPCSIKDIEDSKAKRFNASSVFLKRLLKYVGFDLSLKAKDKSIPLKLLNCTKENASNLLKGLFDTDGYCVIQENRAKNAKAVLVGFTSSSPFLTTQIQSLLLQFGIACKRGVSFKGGKLEIKGKVYDCNKAEHLVITSYNNVFKYQQEIGFNIERKSNKLNVIEEYKYQNGEFSDYVPFVGEYLKKKNGSKSICYKKDGKKRCLTFRDNTSKTQIRELTKALSDEEDIKKLKELSRNDLFFDKVQNVEKKESITVDITVENEHNYVSNGIINHNSYSTAIYAALEAVLTQGIKIGIFSASFRQCLTGDTLLLSESGLKTLEEVRVGEKIYAKDGLQEVKNKWKNPPSEGLTLKTKRGYSISGKKEHRILVPQKGDFEYKYIKKLNIGDAVLVRQEATDEGFVDTIESVSLLKNIVTYDIEVENEHCYWGNGFVNHNSKMIFSYIEDLANRPEATLFKQCITHVSKQTDGWEMKIGKSSIKALPLGSGEKLRGFRFQRIIIDEFLLMPEKIFNEVISPFLSNVANPIERQNLYNLESLLIEQGKLNEEDRHKWPNNKLIALSSASYKFEYLHKLYAQFDHLITHEKTNNDTAKRCIMQLSYDCAPSQLYDANLVNQSRATMSTSQFEREFGAKFTDDSDGYFKISQMNACTVPIGELPCIEVQGSPGSKYILAFDPSWSQEEKSDEFAIQILKLHEESSKVTLVHGYALAGTSLKYHIRYMMYCLESFNIVAICGDYMGGVQFIQSCNESDHFVKKKQKLQTIDVPFDNPEDYLADLRKYKNDYNASEGKIVFLRKPTSKWIRQANEQLQGDIIHKRIFFGSRPIDGDYSGQLAKDIPIADIKFLKSSEDAKLGSKGQRMVDFVDHQGDMIDLTKNECALIQITQTAQGTQTFDLPANLKRSTSPDKTRKDSYSALVLGNWMSKVYFDCNSKDLDRNYETFTPQFIN